MFNKTKILTILILSFLVVSTYVQSSSRNTINFTKHVIDESFDGAVSVYACDVDGDTDIDVLGAAWYFASIAWWENNGAEKFTKHVIDDSFDGAVSVYACDVDGDTDIDVLGAADGAYEIAWWENNGAESFTKHVIDDSFDEAHSVFACDVDGDTDIDVLGAASYIDEIAWWENNGEESFTKHVIDDSFDFAVSVFACDVDGDTDIDVLGAAGSDDAIAWWENNGAEKFTKHVIDDSFDGAVSVYACDVDGDTDIDVLGAAWSADDIAWWENNGAESFTKHVIDDIFFGAQSVYACDVDGDTDIDVLGAAFDAAYIVWWENNGAESFTKHVIDNSFDGAQSVYACDVDGDTNIDVLGAAFVDKSIAWWENDILLNFIPFANFTYTPLQPDVGEIISFTDTSYDSDGNITNYTWYFEDNISYEMNPTYQFDDSGIYPLMLEVMDDDGYMDAVAKLIPVDFQMMPISNVLSGWNFISAPYNHTQDTHEFILKHDGYYYNWTQATTTINPTDSPLINQYMFGWNRSLQRYLFERNLEPGYGYWMYAYQPCELWNQYDEIHEDEYITVLQPGWNSISIPFNQSIDKIDVLVDDVDWNTAVANLWVNNFVFYWNRGAQYYDLADTFIPGEAYWVYAYQECVLKRNN